MRGDNAGPTIEARYERSQEWSTFHTFQHDRAGVVCTSLARPGPGDDLLVLAGVNPPRDGLSLFALDREGNELWGENVSDPRHWPGCQLASEFYVTHLLAYDIDGVPGDELIVVASDGREFATYVGVFDPRQRIFTARYWHLGKFDKVSIAPAFFGNGRHGLLITGHNNKLDGWDEYSVGDAGPVADYEWVPIAMTLDLSTMSGTKLINVPDTNGRVPDMELVLPSCYAFLNATDGRIKAVDQVTRQRRELDGRDATLMFQDLRVVKCLVTDRLRQCLELAIDRPLVRFGAATFKLTSGMKDAGLGGKAHTSIDRFSVLNRAERRGAA